MIYNRLKLDSVQVQITCTHCKKPKANTKLSHIQYDSYVTRVQYDHNLIQYKNRTQYDSFVTYVLPLLTESICNLNIY